MTAINGDEGAFGTDPRRCDHTNTAPLTDAEDECHDCGSVVARNTASPPVGVDYHVSDGRGPRRVRRQSPR